MNTANPLSGAAITQVGIVVGDIERAAQTYADLFGVPVSQVRITEPPAKGRWEYRGLPCRGRAKLAFFKSGSLSIELVEPVGGPTTWREFLEEHGQGVHHVAIHVEGIQKVLGALAQRGIHAIQSGDYKGGRYAYVDARESIGLIIELLETQQR